MARPTIRRAADTSVSLNSANFIGGDPLLIQQLLNPYPSFGFDFTHLNAINSDLAIKAFIDPVTQERLALAERLARISPGSGNGFFFLDGGGAYALPADSSVEAGADQVEGQEQPQQQSPQQQQQPIIIIQQPASQPATTDSQPGSAPQQDAPLRDVGQFTLVLSSGKEIEAVAFTRVNDKIVYITSKGSRHTFALSDLDSDATIRVNQERGTPLQLPF